MTEIASMASMASVEINTAEAARISREYQKRLGELAFVRQEVAQSEQQMSELFAALEGKEVWLSGNVTYVTRGGTRVIVDGGGTQIRPDKYVIAQAQCPFDRFSVGITSSPETFVKYPSSYNEICYSAVQLYETEQDMIYAQAKYDRDRATQPEG
jgi:hypothetical protein